MVLNSDTG